MSNDREEEYDTVEEKLEERIAILREELMLRKELQLGAEKERDALASRCQRLEAERNSAREALEQHSRRGFEICLDCQKNPNKPLDTSKQKG